MHVSTTEVTYSIVGYVAKTVIYCRFNKYRFYCGESIL